MTLSLMAVALWAAGFVLNAALLSVLFYKRRYRLVPWFTSWISFGILYTVTLFVGYRMGSKQVYAALYWGGAIVDFLLQCAVVWEIAGAVLRRSGGWVQGAKTRVISIAAAGPVVAGMLAWAMTPAATTRLNALSARGSVFTTILICFLFTAVVLTSQQLGLGWRSHIMRESYGLVLWAIVSFITDTLHAYWRTKGQFMNLEDLRIVVYQGSLIYWTVAFWLPEPEADAMPVNAAARLDKFKRGSTI